RTLVGEGPRGACRRSGAGQPARARRAGSATQEAGPVNPVTEIQARIADLETRFGDPAATPPEPDPATARASFEQVLATALSSRATRGTAAPGSWFGPLAWPMAPGAAGASTGVPPEAARARWRPAIETAALQAGVPVELLEALVW